MRQIDVERLIDAVADEFNCYAAFMRQARELSDRSLKQFRLRKAMVREVLNYFDCQQTAVWYLTEVLDMSTEQIERLYVATRAVEKWRRKNGSDRFLPKKTQKKIEKFIFGGKR